MKSKSSNYLFSRFFLKNIIILFLISVSGYFIISAWLSNYTMHGENINVPDLRGIKISKLENVLKEHNFQYAIVDSLYDGEKEPGSVLDQDPAPKSKVKRNRTLYLTINSFNPPDVKMPDLVDVSYRQAEAMLQSYGLVTGEISYESDLAKNAVLEQRYKNRVIKPGTLLPKGSIIDLVLGDGLIDLEINIPNLIGLTREQAQTLLRRFSLNIGIVQYDDEEESASAIIYRQSPSSDDGETLKPGSSVDIYLR